MSTPLKGIFMCALFAIVLKMQMNLEIDQTATRYLKNAVEIAVHDASLAVDMVKLAEGQLVFDRTKARENFDESLEKNLKLVNETYNPKANTFFTNPIDVLEVEPGVELVFLDDSTVTSFPFVYTTSSYRGIIENIEGPSIIAIVQTESPRFFHYDASATESPKIVEKPMVITQAAAYEYRYR